MQRWKKAIGTRNFRTVCSVIRFAHFSAAFYTDTFFLYSLISIFFVSINFISHPITRAHMGARKYFYEGQKPKLFFLVLHSNIPPLNFVPFLHFRKTVFLRHGYNTFSWQLVPKKHGIRLFSPACLSLWVLMFALVVNFNTTVRLICAFDIYARKLTSRQNNV